ncbi:hypothetical protein [Streptomyces sp. NPDC058371]|uniref:hypothetical protein n=1 Tax=Streptomyces sp. NPDC058371 TaxID=3346463 RepID=UPI00364B09D1
MDPAAPGAVAQRPASVAAPAAPAEADRRPAPLPRSGRPAPPGRVPWRWPGRRAEFALAAVAVAYAIAQLVFVVPHLAHVLGWDETVYVSQVDPRNPAAYFSAPRSRGTSVLVAPVLALTDSVLALRVTLALLSAAALYAAYRIWRPLTGRTTTALAALLFAGLWITELSGAEAMPNLWVALGAVAATGWFLRAPAEPHAGWWTAACLAGVALVRTPDACWLALPLLATAVLVRSRRRVLPYLLVGPAVGAADWIAEAYVRFGGIGQRLRVSGATEGGMQLHLNLYNAWRSLNGPELCRPCTVQQNHPELTLWWLALPLLAVAALALCLRDRKRGRARTAVPVAAAVCLSVPYLLLLGYSAPRFLLPAYAMLALPVAGVLVRVARTGRPLLLAVGVVLALQLVSQYAVLQHQVANVAATDQRYRAAADGLRALGLRAPCLVAGPHALPVGYDAGCASAETAGNNRSTTAGSIVARAEREPTAVLTAGGGRPPHYARDWTPYKLPGTHGWTAWRAPHTTPS